MNNLEFKLDDAIDIIEEVIENGGEFRLFPKGFSMRPLIVQGRDSVVLRRNKTCPAAKHDIAFKFSYISDIFFYNRLVYCFI